MVPVPEADTLADLNEKILRQCVSYGNHKMAGRDRNVNALYEEEKEHLLALPVTVFSNLQASSGRVDKYATVIVDKNRYSVPSGYAGYRVKVLRHADRVEIFTGTKKIGKHERSYGNNKWILDPNHYLLETSTRCVASYPPPVHQASALPQASSRFAVTRDTLAV